MCGLSPLASFYFIIIIIIIIIIIVVVVVVDDDTDYWVCLSSDHLFQVYYKVRQVLLQSATGITKCDNFITKCDRYYKVGRLLQSATVHTRSTNLLHTVSYKALQPHKLSQYTLATRLSSC